MGPQYVPVEHSSLIVHIMPDAPQLHGSHVEDDPHVRPVRHVMLALQVWPTPWPAGTGLPVEPPVPVPVAVAPRPPSANVVPP
jgi:hypothetical protein